MVGLWDENVILELSGGRRVSIKLDALRSESRIQAQELAKRLVSSRSERIKELQGQAAEAAAPAPNPLPQPPPAPAYTPPRMGAQAGEFLQQIDQAVMDGHVLAIYDALPPSYRNDVNEIVKLSVQKINPEVWQSLVGTMGQLGDLIVTRQRWVLSSPRIQALPPEAFDAIQGQLITAAGLLRDGFTAEAMQLEKLQTMDFGQWLAERDQVIAPHLARLFEQAGVDAARQFTVDSERDGTAIVSIESVAGKSKLTLQLVEGYWVPKTLADGWAKSVAAQKELLAQAPAGSLLESYALLVEPLAPMLGPLAAAPDAGTFHEAMEAILTPAEAVASTVTTMLGRSINLASSGSSGYDGEMQGMDAYDQEMQMQMQMDMEMSQQDMEMDMESDMSSGDEP